MNGVVFALFLPLYAAGAPQAPTPEEVRTVTRSLLESMCSGQCDVIDVQIRNKRAVPVGGVEPGFDDTPAVRMVPGEIGLRLLFDSKLEPKYRKFVVDRVKHRVGEMGLPVLVAETVQAFPAPPKLPDPEPEAPRAQEPPPQPAPQPQLAPPQPAPLPPPPEKPDLWSALILRLIEALPLLLGFGLLAWLILRVLNRLDGPAGRTKREEEEDDDDVLTPEIVEEPSRVGGHAVTRLPPPSSDQLTRDLERHRGSTRRIFRRLLLKGEHDTVARAVALLGDFVVSDLAHEPALRSSLQEAGARTAAILRAAMTDEECEELLRSIQAELVADRVAYRADDVRKEFETLLGWSPETFAALKSRLDDRLGLLLVRHAPTHLTESWLTGLAPKSRADLVRRLLSAPAAEPEEILQLKDGIEAEGDAAVVGGYEADHIIDLIDSLPAGEQESVVSDLESKRPDFVRRNLGSLPIESSLLRVPDHALSAAWAQVPFEDWIAYLRVAPEAIRTRAVALSPERLRVGLKDELGLRVAADPERATDARRRIVRAALSAAPRGSASTELTVVEKEAGETRLAKRES